MTQPKLYKDKANGKIMGVCAGYATYLGMSVHWLRFISVIALFIFIFPSMMFVYLFMGFMLKDKPADTTLQDQRAIIKEILKEVEEQHAQLDDRMKTLENYVTSNDFDLKCKIWRL